MSQFTDSEKNEVLDEIIRARRTIRNFSPDAPPREMVTKVIEAGLHAPYAKAAVETFQDGYFRRFFVVLAGTESMARVSTLLNGRILELAADLERKAESDPVYREKSRVWAQRLKWFSDLGHLPGVTNAPYYIIIAEHRGIPDLGQHSLAHVLENMWLKATALGLAFQITSVMAKMGDHPELCSVLGLVPGDWDFMGCALGYMRKEIGPSKRPPVEELTRWLP